MVLCISCVATAILLKSVKHLFSWPLLPEAQLQPVFPIVGNLSIATSLAHYSLQASSYIKSARKRSRVSTRRQLNHSRA